MQVRALLEKRDSYFRMMETIPVQAYLGAAGGSMALSLLLRMLGRKEAANVVGQLPTTLMLMALVYKLLKPSSEDAQRHGGEAIRQASQIITTSH